MADHQAADLVISRLGVAVRLRAQRAASSCLITIGAFVARLEVFTDTMGKHRFSVVRSLLHRTKNLAAKPRVLSHLTAPTKSGKFVGGEIWLCALGGHGSVDAASAVNGIQNLTMTSPSSPPPLPPVPPRLRATTP